MISRLGTLALFGLRMVVMAPPVAAQDSLPPQSTVELQNRVNNAFLARVRRELALTPDQSARLEGVITKVFERRGVLERENRQLHVALNRQLQLGNAAKPARVSQLLDQIAQNESAYVATFGNEMRAVAPILSPVQRAQFQRLRDQFQQQVRNLQLQGRGAAPNPPPARATLTKPPPARGAKAGG